MSTPVLRPESCTGGRPSEHFTSTMAAGRAQNQTRAEAAGAQSLVMWEPPRARLDEPPIDPPLDQNASSPVGHYVHSTYTPYLLLNILDIVLHMYIGL